MRYKILLTVIVFVTIINTKAQNSLLQSGPMLGYSTMREVSIWIQTTAPASVRIEYWDKFNHAIKYSTDVVNTKKVDAFTAKLIADQLEPGKEYNYSVYINDHLLEFGYPTKFKTQELWQWRKNPPGIKFAFASCLYINEDEYDRPGKPYGGDYEILEHVYSGKPEFMIWMGDNVYLREADWSARSSILKRYTHTRSTDELQKLLANTHHYATWDDHDFGPNNSDRSFWNKATTLEVFKLFWANPSFGVMGKPGVTTQFQWGDLDFFLMDDRYYRSPENRESTEREILGVHQVDWLMDALTSSFAPFKFVVIGTQFLNPDPGGENHSAYPSERKRIIDLITTEKIPGVIFLTGDVHRSEVTKLERQGTYPLYEFTISPLTAGPSSRVYPNSARIEESLLPDRNFGFIEVTGERKNRKLTMSIIKKSGEVHYTISLHENELRQKE